MLGKTDLVLLMKAQITQKGIIFPNLFVVNYVRVGTRSLLQYFIWLKSKTVQIYLVVKSVKLLLFLVYATETCDNIPVCTCYQ